ncbi:MAG: ABC transporter ATP-binding protein [Acidobacteriota bacterium]
MIVIDVQNVSKIYRKYSSRYRFQTLKSALLRGTFFKELRPDEIIHALDSVSFSVKKGATLGIIGANGSGKSTLLKVIAGITKPTEGAVNVDGKVSALIELGVGFHPEISARENIYINGIMLGLSKKEISEKFDEIVKFAELEEFIDQPVKTYSSGMYMRLGFSIAINVNPDILLIDEVLAVGDAAFVPKCLDRIADFKRRQKTILFVSHDLTTVENICDEVIWLKKGKCQTKGDPKRVVDAYLKDVAQITEEKLETLHKEKEKEAEREELAPQIEEKREARWGSREVEILSVKLKSSDGEEKWVFHEGEEMRIELEVESKKKIDDFVFGIGIFNPQGMSVYGTNTNFEDFVSDHLEGRGKVTFKIKNLNLINGSYFLDVAIHKRDGYAYDYHRSLYEFRVFSRKKDIGIWRPNHSWTFSPNIKWKK